MTIYDQNVAKIKDMLPNCEARVLAFMSACASEGIYFVIVEAYRPQERQNRLFTQGRSFEDIQSLYNARQISYTQFESLKRLYDAKKNLHGSRVTWTLNSEHTKGKAFDIEPIINGIETQKSRKQALDIIARIGSRFGVERPARTYALGDYGHFEVYDLPIPEKKVTDPNNIHVKMAEVRRLARQQKNMVAS